MKMKYLLMVFVGLLLITSCAIESNNGEAANPAVETEETVEEPELTAEELAVRSKELMAKVITASSVNLELNGEDKWVISEDAFTKLMKIKQQIYIISGNMENYTVESYNEMGNEFLSFVKTIPVLEDEKANIELQKVLLATKDQCLHLVESNKQNAQIAVINLSIIYDSVPNYFTGLKK